MRRQARGEARHAAPPATGFDRTTDAAVTLEWQWLAGYRIVRTLGQGSRATVYLGHAGTAPGGAGAAEATVAVKVFEPHVSGESIDAEIEALTAVGSIASTETTPAATHVVRLLDVAMSPLRPRCLVLERLTGDRSAHFWLGRSH